MMKLPMNSTGMIMNVIQPHTGHIATQNAIIPLVPQKAEVGTAHGAYFS